MIEIRINKQQRNKLSDLPMSASGYERNSAVLHLYQSDRRLFQTSSHEAIVSAIASMSFPVSLLMVHLCRCPFA